MKPLFSFKRLLTLLLCLMILLGGFNLPAAAENKLSITIEDAWLEMSEDDRYLCFKIRNISSTPVYDPNFTASLLDAQGDIMEDCGFYHTGVLLSGQGCTLKGYLSGIAPGGVQVSQIFASTTPDTSDIHTIHLLYTKSLTEAAPTPAPTAENTPKPTTPPYLLTDAWLTRDNNYTNRSFSVGRYNQLYNVRQLDGFAMSGFPVASLYASPDSVSLSFVTPRQKSSAVSDFKKLEKELEKLYSYCDRPDANGPTHTTNSALYALAQMGGGQTYFVDYSYYLDPQFSVAIEHYLSYVNGEYGHYVDYTFLKPEKLKNPQPATPSPTPQTPLSPAALSEVSLGDIVTFGAYEQDNNQANGPEPLEWQVLAVEKDSALLIASVGIDTPIFSNAEGMEGSDEENLNWQTSNHRKWLNGDFFQKAFTADEKSAILTSQLTTSDKSGTFTTSDQVFSLSVAEVKKYFANTAAMACKPSAYAKAKLKLQNGAVDAKGNCLWALRDMTSVFSGRDSYAFMETQLNEVAFVDGAAGVSSNTYIPGFNFLVTIRPAMWVQRSSALKVNGLDDLTNTLNNPPVLQFEIAASATPSDELYLGMQLVEIIANLPRGLMVTQVDENSPAALESIQRNDIIVGLNEEPVTSLADFMAFYNGSVVGESLELDLLRPVYTVDENYTINGSIRWESLKAFPTFEGKPQATEPAYTARVTLKNSDTLRLRNEAGKSFSSIPDGAVVSLLGYNAQGNYAHVVYNGQEGYVDPAYLTQENEPAILSLVREMDAIAGVPHWVCMRRYDPDNEHLAWFSSGTHMTDYPQSNCWRFSFCHEYTLFCWENIPQQNALWAANYLLRLGGWKVQVCDQDDTVWISDPGDVWRTNVVAEAMDSVLVTYPPMEDAASAQPAVASVFPQTGYVVSPSFTLRAEPSFDSKGPYIESNDGFIVLEEAKNGSTPWYKIRLSDNREGYIAAYQVTFTKPAVRATVAPTAQTTTGVTNKGSVNVRSTASAKGKRVTQLKKGVSLTVLGEEMEGSTKWYKIRLENGTEGYIRGDLVNISGAPAASSPAAKKVPVDASAAYKKAKGSVCKNKVRKQHVINCEASLTGKNFSFLMTSVDSVYQEVAASLRFTEAAAKEDMRLVLGIDLLNPFRVMGSASPTTVKIKIDGKTHDIWASQWESLASVVMIDFSEDIQLFEKIVNASKTEIIITYTNWTTDTFVLKKGQPNHDTVKTTWNVFKAGKLDKVF